MKKSWLSVLNGNKLTIGMTLLIFAGPAFGICDHPSNIKSIFFASGSTPPSGQGEVYFRGGRFAAITGNNSNCPIGQTVSPRFLPLDCIVIYDDGPSLCRIVSHPNAVCTEQYDGGQLIENRCMSV